MISLIRKGSFGMKIWLAAIFLISSMAHAARLENVKVLNVEYGRDSVEVKMQLAGAAANSYFLISIMKTDPDSFEKLGHVQKKVGLKDKYRLDLNIPSFSPDPPGSHYRSPDITFFGGENREPNGKNKAQKPTKKK